MIWIDVSLLVSTSLSLAVARVFVGDTVCCGTEAVLDVVVDSVMGIGRWGFGCLRWIEPKSIGFGTRT